MVTIRIARSEDAPFIALHAHRLLEFNLPAWRKNEKEEMVKADIRHITTALQAGNAEDCIFIAEDQFKNPLGFIRLVMQKDYYTGERHAHINDIVVIAESEGKGIGRLLMEKADDWAKENKARWITLNVFKENEHAQRVYEKAGYKMEWIKYLKDISGE